MQGHELGARIAAVRDRIDAAAARAGRHPDTVRLVAVTKGVDAARVQEAASHGVRDMGENRVLEAADKRTSVDADVHWHLIGHLQSNKAARAAEIFDAVHSVDSVKVATALARHRPQHLQLQALLIEIDFTKIAGRSGVAEDGADQLLHQVAGLPGVHLLGLMTIAPPLPDAEAARPYFARLRTLRDTLEAASGWALPELSMGMSSDFEVAVEEGATMVRVGTAIFGPRPQPH